MELANKNAMVVGLGITGRSLASFLTARGAKLCLVDKREDIDRAPFPAAATFLLGDERKAWLDDVDLLLPSPGVPRDSLLLREAQHRRIPILSEIELAFRSDSPPIIAITGTNGKSTVTELIGAILGKARRRTFVGGNLGTPLLEAIGKNFELAVVEVSSFQLEWIEQFAPQVGVYLNLTEDHLYRYRNLEEYGFFKSRLFANQNAENWAVLNADDRRVWNLKQSVRARVVGFGANRPQAQQAIWPEGQALRYECGARKGAIRLEHFKLPGRHNLANAMAACAAALAAGVAPEIIEQTLAEFKGLPHRIEFVRELDGVAYYDDSKGTNVDAVVVALASFERPVILLAGGMDKGGDFAPLCNPIRERVRHTILYGQARARMHGALCGTCGGNLDVVEDLSQAVTRAAALARPGDVVLLSPACSSFDQFKDYAERGRIFKELVRAL